MVDAAMAREKSQEVPAHVPPDLVISCDFHSASGFAIDPFATIKWQRTEAPRIFFTPEHYLSPGSWVVTKAEDIRFVLQTPELFSSRDQISFGALVGETWDLIPLEADPPSHAAYRALLNPLFAPKQIKKLETELATVAAALVEKVQPQGQAEFMKCFSQPFPVSVFLQILDFPREEMNTFLDWEHGLLKSFDLGTRKNSARKIVDYLRAVINARRKSPGEDLVSLTTQFKIDDKPLSDDEIVGMCFLLFVAGMDTVTMSLGFHFHHLAADQDLQARLRADRDMIPVAVEEFLRLYSIIQVHRRVTKDTVIAGVALKAGDCVTIPTSNASRDRREFTDPDAFDIARGNNRHVAFSFGMHRCIGSHLARRELVTAMNTWFDRVPQFRLQAGKPYRTHGGGVLGVEELHLAWD